MNLQEMSAFIQGLQNPQQYAMKMLEQQAQGNPFYQNLLMLAKQGNTSQLESIVRNVVNQQGGDFDRSFQSFKQLFR